MFMLLCYIFLIIVGGYFVIHAEKTAKSKIRQNEQNEDDENIDETEIIRITKNIKITATATIIFGIIFLIWDIIGVIS